MIPMRHLIKRITAHNFFLNTVKEKIKTEVSANLKMSQVFGRWSNQCICSGAVVRDFVKRYFGPSELCTPFTIFVAFLIRDSNSSITFELVLWNYFTG